MSTTSHDELIQQLAALGDEIDRRIDIGDSLAATVLEDLRSDPAGRSRNPWLVAASITIAVAVGVLLVPDSRRAVARWFGIDGVKIEIEPDITRGPPTDVRAEVGPGSSAVVVVEGREILVSAIEASFDENLLTKTVSGSGDLIEVDVDGARGLWIGSASHDVLYEVAESEIVVERVAGRTLLWNDGGVLYRVEGFDRLDDALEFARVGVSPIADV